MSQLTNDDDSRREARAESLLQEEFVQAWEHYRHNEQLRSQYINYTFTVTLATIAAAIPLAPLVGRNPNTVPLAGLFLLTYVLLIAFSLVAIVKISAVMAHYRQAWTRIRHHFYDTASPRFDFENLDVSRAGNMVGSPWFRLQNWAEFIHACLLLAGTCAACVLEVALLIDGAVWWQLTLVTLTTLATVVIAVFCCVAMLRGNRTAVPRLASSGAKQASRSGGPAAP